MPNIRNYTIAAMSRNRITLGEIMLDTAIVWDPTITSFTQGDKTLKSDVDRHFNLRDVNDYQSYFMSHLTEELQEDLKDTFGTDGEIAWNLLLQINDVGHYGFDYDEEEDKELFEIYYQDALDEYVGDADFNSLTESAKDAIVNKCIEQAKQVVVSDKEYNYECNITLEEV